MTTSTSEMPEVTDRLDRLEGEMSELRHTLSNLADIVVGDIRDRRQTAAGLPAPEIPIPASLVPGGKTTMNAVNVLRRPWLLTELLREIGTMVRMSLHPRYRVRRATQLTAMLLFGFLIANHLMFNFLLLHIPVVSEALQCLVDIVIGVLLYKVLSREAARYRQAIAMGLPGRSWTPTPASLLHNDPETAAVTREESP